MVYLETEHWPSPVGYNLVALPGFLILEASRWGRSGIEPDEDIPSADRARNVVCAQVDEFGQLQPIHEDGTGDFWCVIGPGDEPLTPEAVANAKKDREHIRKITRPIQEP